MKLRLREWQTIEKTSFLKRQNFEGMAHKKMIFLKNLIISQANRLQLKSKSLHKIIFIISINICV
jgi:hypothetical protein